MSTATPQRATLPHDGHFPERLRARRLRLGWSQVDLAVNSGMKPSGFRTIQEWELGKSAPRPGGHILEVAKTLGVSMPWLLWGDEEDSDGSA
jgi:transcriptional regulator with XRE-family HTH domain